MKKRLKLGVLGSGKGSNFRAVVEKINDGKLDAEVRIVISDVADAGILSYARDYQIPALYVHPGKFRTKIEEEVEQDIVRLLQEANVELVVLAGFMRVVKRRLLEAFPRAIFTHRCCPISPVWKPGNRRWQPVYQSPAVLCTTSKQVLIRARSSINELCQSLREIRQNYFMPGFKRRNTSFYLR
jgi:Formyl transferase